MNLSPLITFSVFLLSSSTAWAINCTRAKTVTEVAICSNPTLKTSDNYLSESYSTIRGTVTADIFDVIRKDQRKWIQQRNTKCGGDTLCLMQEIQARTTALSGLIQKYMEQTNSDKEHPEKSYSAIPLSSSTPSSIRPEYIRPNLAPNGQSWPAKADYIVGYHKLHADGLSTVTVDNSQNDSDVFVKLVSLDSPQAYPVRQFYIPAFGGFVLNRVTSGNYDIRYRDLSNGGLSRSETFNLVETPTYNGTQFSNMTMTLYKVQNGNMQTYGLSEAEF